MTNGRGHGRIFVPQPPDGWCQEVVTMMMIMINEDDHHHHHLLPVTKPYPYWAITAIFRSHTVHPQRNLMPTD